MRAFLRVSNHISISVFLLIFLIGIIALTRLGDRAGAAGINTIQNATVTSVNAASFTSPLARGTIAAAFGSNLATQLVNAQSLPLPTELGGTSVRLIDSNNVEYRAPLFFVSSGQINYFIPDQVAPGAVRVIVTSGNGSTSQGEMQVVSASPAIFTTTFNGRGVPIALTTFNGSYFEGVSNPDGSAKPISPGSTWRPNYLSIFATGLRNASNVRVKIGNVEVTPLYAGAQGSYVGLDQVNVAVPSNLPGGTIDLTIIADGSVSNITQFQMQGQTAPSQNMLSVTDVQTIIAQAVAKAVQLNMNVTVGVTDKEGNVLGVFRMNGAPATTRIGAFNLQNGQRLKPPDPDGLQDTDVPASFATISKAGTASFFSTQGSGISSRTASFIIQEHFPPQVQNQPGGPLFGVQFSQLPCTDVKMPNLPLGISGDPGGVPIYKNGMAAGGVGIEADGLYSIDVNTMDVDQTAEEIIAVAATLGFETAQTLRIDNVLVDGMRLPFVNAVQTGGAAPPFATLPGTVDPMFPIRAAAPSRFNPLTLAGVVGRVDPRFFPFIDSPSGNAVKLLAADVNTIISQAALQSRRTRAAIRVGGATPAEVNIAVVDTNGVVLGLFSTNDAPIFGFDVSAQKARTAVFFTSPTAAAQLNAAEGGRFAKFVTASIADGIRLDGTIAFSNRAQGFMSRPFFPDGLDNTQNGAFSKPINVWSPFNNGLQIALVRTALVNILSGVPVTSCTAIPTLPSGIQIFAGSVPLYKNGVMVGAIGISGDGIDQDDIIAATGSVGFEAPANIRADQFNARGVRLPYVKFPRHPNL